MVAEVRNLIFSDAELHDALTPLMRRRGEAVPGPQPVRSRLSSMDGGITTVVLDYTYDKQVRRFSDAEVLTALVAYCIRCKVPLPRAATKTLTRTADQMTLTIHTERGAMARGQTRAA